VDKGTLVEFRLQGQRRLAVADRPEGKKHWIVLDQNRQPHTLHPRDITFEISGQTFKPDDLSGFQAEVNHYLDPESLEVAWEFWQEEGGLVTPVGLAEFLFSQQLPSQCYAAHCLLSDDKLYFKQKGEAYEPRSAAQIQELKHQLHREEQRQQERQAFFDRVNQALAGTGVTWEASDRSRLEVLERFATLGEESNQRAQAQELLAQLQRPTIPEAAFTLLVDLGVWTLHENLFLRRSQIPIQFPNSVLEATQTCLMNPPPDLDQGRRLDLTHLKVYTIDDESTQEIDDGLSLEFVESEKARVWVHIADPSRWLTAGDVLDLEARRRSTTVYLPTGMVPMFPTELATGPMSLVQGQVCYALSFGILLDAAGGVESFEIAPSLIKPTYRLTYEDVDEMLELGIAAEAELQALATAAQRRRQWRLAQGAISINMPESSIKVVDDQIEIEVLSDSAARHLVAEMMILTGEVAARFGQAQALPLPFRGQPQPELPPDEELMLLAPGPVRDCAIRRCMPRSEVGVTAARHASLGLETYCQVTSPIRRYTDLIAHFQIKAHLRGDILPFDAEALKLLLASVTTTAYEATLVERQTNRYWSLEYLRRCSSAQIWSALMLRWLREHENLGLVLLEDLGVELAMRFNRDVQPGDQLQLRVSYADPRSDRIHLEEVAIQAEQLVGG
jgi:exoribonuclease II